jgi:hypothetical protein
MKRRTCAALLAVALAVALAVGLLPARMALVAGGPSHQPSGSGERWDAGPTLADGSWGEFAQGGPGEFGPPGPPRRDDDRPPPPPRDRGGPDGDRHHPPRPFDGRHDGPPPFDREGPPGPDHRPPGPPHGPWGDLQSLEKIDPEMYKVLKQDQDLERQTRELVMQYRRAPSAEREKLKPQITELVNKHFDVRQAHRSLELKRLEGELQRLREAIDRRSKARKEIVDKRVSELIGREDELRF